MSPAETPSAATGNPEPTGDRPLLDCRRDFPALARQHKGQPIAFLDGPAGSQVPQAVIDETARYYVDLNTNTHGAFGTSRDLDGAMAESREVAAAFLGASHWRQVAFGQNMTTLAYSLSHALAREIEPGDEVVITQLDHEANRGPWLQLQERGAVVREVALGADGQLDEDDFERKIGERTRLVALGLASNALGTVNPLEPALSLARQVGAKVVLDAVHYAPHLPVDVEAMGADFLFCSAYKFYGPHIGLLWSRDGLIDSLPTDRLRTQEQEAPYRIETGTLNHAAILGTKAAIDYIASWGAGAGLRERIVSAMERIAGHEHALASRLWEGVAELPGVTAWGPDFSTASRAPTVSFTVDGMPAAAAAARLGDEGIQVWDGDFYAVRPVEILGLAERGGLVRVGVSMYNTSDEIDRLLAALSRLTP